MNIAGWTEAELAERSGVPEAKIRDAVDYRPELTCEEVRRLAVALGLNEVGVCALGAGRYPLPAVGGLPFALWPLRMPHGIGMANAYLVAEEGASHGLLFDTGAGIGALAAAWPAAIEGLDAVFLTHVETEHAGGLCDVVARFGAGGRTRAFIPRGAAAPCGGPIGEGETVAFGALEVTVFSTPGHVRAHNCYLVGAAGAPSGTPLLIAGDLIFAGSAGGGYFCQRRLRENLRRILAAVPPRTVIAPGHGPLTTVENELKFNPFVT
jgi:glyoxylase-like metal-dependent hydrolase (beta-lactamase superfamily II)